LEKGKDRRVLEIPKRIGQVDSNNLKNNQPESEPVFFVNKLKLSL
jgi:hypothetical protein